MSPFAVLVLAHLVADFLFQIRWMAMNKAHQWLPLLAHSLVYTLVLGGVAYIAFGGLSLLGVLLIFFAHVFLDRRTFVHWWTKNIMGVDLEKNWWLTIVVDQTFHFLVIALALWFN